ALEEPGHFIDDCECNHKNSVSRGMIVALILHNLIEGIAMGLTAVSDMRLGISMAIGIALHNIPIGATLAISIKAAGEKQTRAVLASVFVGLSQPLGALAGLLLFKGPNMEGALSALMAVVAGILVFISFDELWPAARLNGSRKTTIIALLAGICFIPVAEMLI
ncbi:MAG: ZIP family metal transporter, partial [Sphaerochaetaceae bacterium]|nr:ZIP family metal transporter [Sphaerochaetaceae bacterium]